MHRNAPRNIIASIESCIKEGHAAICTLSLHNKQPVYLQGVLYSVEEAELTEYGRRGEPGVCS